MTSIDLLESHADLTDSGASSGCLDRETEQVTLSTLGSLGQSFKASLGLRLISVGLGCLDPIDLLLPDILVINLKHIEVLLLLVKTILVDADNNLST